MAKLHARSAPLALALLLAGCGEQAIADGTQQADPATGAQPVPAGKKAAQKAGPIPSGDMTEPPAPPDNQTQAPPDESRPADAPPDGAPPEDAPDSRDRTLDPPEDAIPPNVDTPPDIAPEDVETDTPPPQSEPTN